MNYSYGMCNLWLHYVKKLSVEKLLDCYMYSERCPNIDDNDNDVDIATGHQMFSIWIRGTVYTFRGPEWTRMLSSHEDSQLSRHINQTVVEDFERLVIL